MNKYIFICIFLKNIRTTHTYSFISNFNKFDFKNIHLNKNLNKNLKDLKDLNIFHEENLTYDNLDKLICITPGGFNGLYMLGVCNYIKTNYNLTEYKYMGSSAGAWISLLMCYKYNILSLINQLSIFKNNEYIRKNLKKQLSNDFKTNILRITNENDFDLNKLIIGVTHYENLRFNPYIYYNFTNLNDALDACIASSHVPFITNDRLLMKFNNKSVFDGGFDDFPFFMDLYNPTLVVHPKMWIEKRFRLISPFDIYHYYINSTLFSNENYNFKSLYLRGYKNTMANKKYLDKLFI